MKLYRTLAQGLLEAHPEDAARVLESLPDQDALAVLAATPAAVAAATVRHVAPLRAAALLAGLERERAGPIVASLGFDLAANVLRRMDPAVCDALLGALEPGPARALGALLRFPEGTAGALMDPGVLALPADLTAGEAQVRVREAAENVRYNLYVVDREQRLVGVLTLRELFLAQRKSTLASIANPQVLSLPARADRQAILEHPAWADARSVPVVDENGVYLGAVRFRILRRLEEEQRAGAAESGAATVEALGDLFSTGIAGVFGALASSVVQPLPGGDRREK